MIREGNGGRCPPGLSSTTVRKVSSVKRSSGSWQSMVRMQWTDWRGESFLILAARRSRLLIFLMWRCGRTSCLRSQKCLKWFDWLILFDKRFIPVSLKPTELLSEGGKKAAEGVGTFKDKDYNLLSVLVSCMSDCCFSCKSANQCWKTRKLHTTSGDILCLFSCIGGRLTERSFCFLCAIDFFTLFLQLVRQAWTLSDKNCHSHKYLPLFLRHHLFAL